MLSLEKFFFSQNSNTHLICIQIIDRISHGHIQLIRAYFGSFRGDHRHSQVHEAPASAYLLLSTQSRPGRLQDKPGQLLEYLVVVGVLKGLC